MIKVNKNGVLIRNGREIIEDNPQTSNLDAARRGTIAAQILAAHHVSRAHNVNVENPTDTLPTELKLKFDAMASHDITFVNIIQTAMASGLEEFPLPYIFTNCHNSLCAVGGTINADDHSFGLSAAQRYGGVFVPPHLAVIHSYVREVEASCGRMILGSDSHTRYGALGTLAALFGLSLFLGYLAKSADNQQSLRRKYRHTQ